MVINAVFALSGASFLLLMTAGTIVLANGLLNRMSREYDSNLPIDTHWAQNTVKEWSNTI